MRPLCRFTCQCTNSTLYSHHTRALSSSSILHEEKKSPSGSAQTERKSVFPFVLYDPHNEEQQILLRKALTGLKMEGDPRFRRYNFIARAQFYEMIAAQVRTMYRYEHIQAVELLRKMNAENPLRDVGDAEMGTNPFLYKVGDMPYLIYRSNPKVEKPGVWDTVDINVVVGLIWEVVSRHEIIYYNDILKHLPDEVRTSIKECFHDVRVLIKRYPFTFEIVRKGFVRFVPTLTF